MRHTGAVWVLVCSAVLSLPAGGALAGEGGANLVRNASFAEGLDGWAVTPVGDTPLSPPAIDRSVFRGVDMASLRIDAQAGRRTWLRQIGLARDPAARKYRFTVWARCRGLTPDWIIRVGVERWKGNTQLATLQNRHVLGAAEMDWTPTVIEFEPPEGTEEFAVYVALWFSDDLKTMPPPGGGAVWFEDVSLTPVGGAPPAAAAAAPAAKVAVTGFYPLGERGVFTPGQLVQLTLTGRNDDVVPCELDIALKVTDFGGAVVAEKPVRLAAEPGQEFRQTLDLDPPPKLGFFCARATVSLKGQLLDMPATGFCVVSPPAECDPFFGMDPNGMTTDLLGAWRLIGVGSVGIHQPWALSEEEQANLPETMRKAMETRWAPYWQTDFNIVGYVKIDPEFHAPRIKEQTRARREQGLFPYPDALFTELGDAVEAEARAMKDRVRTWVIQEEIDAWISNPNAPAGSGTCELARHILMTRIAYERLKRVDPDFLVAGLSVCMDYGTTPPYQLVRRVMPELRNSCDLLAPDLYCGPYDLGRQRMPGPEAGKMREALLNTQRLQQEWGKTPKLLIAEKGLSVPYHLPPDHPLQQAFANLTARNLIVAKSVEPVIFYSHYLGASPWSCVRMMREGRQSTDEQPVQDFGLWKVTCDPQAALYYHPRAAVAAYATVARVLANTTQPEELSVRQGFYAYLFRKQDRVVAALWTTDPRPYPVRLQLPAAAELCDLMGETRNLPTGETELQVSESPQFLTCAAAPQALGDAIRNAGFPSLAPVKAEAHLSDLSTVTFHLLNQTQQPMEADIVVDPLRTAKLTPLNQQAHLDPGGQATVEFVLTGATIEKLGQEKLAARVTAGGQTVNVAADLDLQPVARLRDGLPVDASLDKYAGARAIVLDGPERLRPASDLFERKLWTGPQDLAVRAYLAWDSQYLRLAARVSDDVHQQRRSGEHLWMDDCLQFALDARNDALRPETTGKVGYDQSDYNLGVALADGGPQWYCWVDRGRTDTGGPRSFPLAIKREGAETLYEAAVPWEALAPLSPEPGKVFGFSFLVFDNDRPEDTQAAYWMELTPGIANGQDPSAYAKFVLMP